MKPDFFGRRFWRAQTVSQFAGVFGLLVALGQAQPRDTLTLTRAQTLIREHPSLNAAWLEVEARKSQVAQAGMPPNPNLSIEAENFAGTGPLSGVGALETTTRLEQTVELGGKRAVRREQALAEARIAESEHALREGELSVELWEAFSDAFRLQELLVILERDTLFLGEVVEVARRRARAGGGGVAEEGKLRLSLSQARIEAAKARTALEVAFHRLALLMSMPAPDFVAVGEPQAGLIPEWDSVVAALERHPRLSRWKAELESRALSLRSVRAQNIPDLGINAGVRHVTSGGDWGLVGGVTVPLPLWNRNKGSMAGWEKRLRSGEQSAEAVRREISAEAFGLWSGIRARSQEIARLRDELLPQAIRVRDATRSAYSQGRLGVLELLDGQRTWLELNEQYIAQMAGYRLDVAKLEALMSASKL